jgi:hypothetical protein
VARTRTLVCVCGSERLRETIQTPRQVLLIRVGKNRDADTDPRKGVTAK